MCFSGKCKSEQVSGDCICKQGKEECNSHISPKHRDRCFNGNDYKLICAECGNKTFVSLDSVKYYERIYGKVNVIDIICNQCNRINEYDISEKKDWYGVYDGKKSFYDIFYCDGIQKEVEESLKKLYSDAQIYSEYDDIHGYRVIFNAKKIDVKNYYKTIIKLGYMTMSFAININMKIIHKDQDLLDAVKELKAEESE